MCQHTSCRELCSHDHQHESSAHDDTAIACIHFSVKLPWQLPLVVVCISKFTFESHLDVSAIRMLDFRCSQNPITRVRPPKQKRSNLTIWDRFLCAANMPIGLASVRSSHKLKPIFNIPCKMSRLFVPRHISFPCRGAGYCVKPLVHKEWIRSRS